MFPECYFNYFNPYYRNDFMDFDSPGKNLRLPKQPQVPDFEQAPGSPIEQDTLYTQGYLKTQIGKRVKIFFLIGTNLVQDREGILTDVGISYVILRELETNYKILCDIYSIKFVTIYPS